MLSFIQKKITLKKEGNKVSSNAQSILTLLGGAGNIEDLTNCATCLRIIVKDIGLFDFTKYISCLKH